MRPRARFALTLMIVGSSAACIDSPLGGGNDNLYPAEACPTPTANSAWTSANITVERILPDRCPFTVQVNTFMLAFAFDGHAPKSQITAAEQITLSIHDWQGFSQGTAYRTWRTDPSDPFKWLSNFDIAAYPGNVKPNTDGNLQDTARFNTYTNYGYAESRLVVNGKATLLRGSLLGPTNAYASGAEYFRAKPAADTVAYRYQWTLNNQTISGATDASEVVSIGTVGTAVLKVLAERADLTVDTMSKTITVTIGAAFTGQSVLTPYQYYEWSVSPLGGTGPYTYEWYFDANYLQTGTSYSNAFNANESHWFDVKVTDALSNVGWSSFNFYTTSEGGGPVELRASPSTPGSPARSAPRRKPPGMP